MKNWAVAWMLYITMVTVAMECSHLLVLLYTLLNSQKLFWKDNV